ncbi:Aldo/keto reductase [Rhizodiscina lignyota]|uniref:Aldo/keto reductase n=1 Tax=Rhizodiscina lignyota TaxID=1504668 RepID=A0A9P4IEH9_9PEZI|nr:Aldo/keto reductase [Rhizodiscina lignyota]
MASSQKAKMKVVFGAMSFGQPSQVTEPEPENPIFNMFQSRIRVNDVETGNSILDVLQKHGYNEIDTARLYGNGTSESLLGELRCQERGLVVSTKYLPMAHSIPRTVLAEGWNFDQRYTADMIRRTIQKSLRELKMRGIHIYYNGPDPTVPLTESLPAIDAVHREGLFVQFGLTRVPAWRVAQIYDACDRWGWVKPTVYQGMYNFLHRGVEPELLPCLRQYGIQFYAFNPMAGGFLAASDPQGASKASYINNAYAAAVELLNPVIEKHGLTLRECALRWLAHHSLLAADKGDAILLGASRAEHLESNLLDLEKGPLPKEIVESLDRAWEQVKGLTPKYFF